MSEGRKQRRNYAAAEKVAILRRHLIDKVPISNLCHEFKLNPNVFYLWQRQFFENGAAAFERSKGSKPREQAHVRTIAALQIKLAQKNEVISELMEDNVRQKKLNGEL